MSDAMNKSFDGAREAADALTQAQAERSLTRFNELFGLLVAEPSENRAAWLTANYKALSDAANYAHMSQARIVNNCMIELPNGICGVRAEKSDEFEKAQKQAAKLNVASTTFTLFDGFTYVEFADPDHGVNALIDWLAQLTSTDAAPEITSERTQLLTELGRRHAQLALSDLHDELVSLSGYVLDANEPKIDLRQAFRRAGRASMSCHFVIEMISPTEPVDPPTMAAIQLEAQRFDYARAAASGITSYLDYIRGVDKADLSSHEQDIRTLMTKMVELAAAARDFKPEPPKVEAQPAFEAQSDDEPTVPLVDADGQLNDVVPRKRTLN